MSAHAHYCARCITQRAPHFARAKGIRAPSLDRSQHRSRHRIVGLLAQWWATRTKRRCLSDALRDVRRGTYAHSQRDSSHAQHEHGR
eukprot:660158-Pleurochrysis_carterae.AAC.1